MAAPPLPPGAVPYQEPQSQAAAPPPLPKGAVPYAQQPAAPAPTPAPGAPPKQALRSPGSAPPPATPKPPPLPVGAQPAPAGAHPWGTQASAAPPPAPLGVFQGIYDTVNHAYVQMQKRQAESAADPLTAAINVLNTPARFLDTLIMHGITPEVFSKAVHNALFIGESADEGSADYEALAKIIKDKGLTYRIPGTDKLEPVGEFARSLLAHTMADPTTFIPIIGQLSRVSGATKALRAVSDGVKATGAGKTAIAAGAKAMEKVHASGVGGVAEWLGKGLRQRPELQAADKGNLEAHAAHAHIGFEHRNIAQVDHELGQSDMNLLEQEKAGLKNVKQTDKGYALPEPVKQRYLYEAYQYGSPAMRKQAIEYGYKETAEQVAARQAAEQLIARKVAAGERTMTPEEQAILRKGMPEGLLDYNLREDYQYLGNPGKAMKDSPAYKAYRPKTAADQDFEFTRDAKWADIGADQYDRVGARLAMGRRAIWQRRALRDTRDYLETHGGIKGVDLSGMDAKTRAATVEDHVVNKLSLNPTRINTPLRFLGKWGSQAVQGSFLPHALNNVGTLTFLKSPIALGRAIGHMAKGGPSAETTERIKNIGALAEYTADPGTVWSKIPGLKQILGGTQTALSKMELSYRAGLLEELDRTMGPSKSLRDEMEKGHQIRDAVVDYRNVPLVVAWMEAAGAPFAAFFGGLTGAVARAVVHHPQLVQAVNRVEQQTNEQFGIELPNPVLTADKLLFDPYRTVLQHGGVLGQGALNATEYRDHFSSASQALAETLRNAGGPVFSQAPPFFNEPYPDPAAGPGGTFTPTAGAQEWLFGAHPFHPKPRPSETKAIERNAARALGE